MSEAIDPPDSLETLQPQDSVSATPATSSAASVALEGEEPVLGPLGRKLVVALVVVLAVIFLVAMVWLLGYLAYTNPPVPGAG